MGTSWRTSGPRWPSVRTDALPMITLLPLQGDFCATALLVYLDPMAVGLSDVEPSLPIQFYRHWSPEIRLGLGGDVVGSVDVRWQFRTQVGHLPRAFLVGVDVEEVRSPLGQSRLAPELELEAAVGTQHLHLLVAPVGDVDVPLQVHCHAGWPMQLAIALPGLAKARQDLAVGGELLDEVIAPIGHVNVAWRVESHPPGEVELTRATARLAPLPDVLPIGGELLHPVVMLVDDIEIVVGVYGDASRAVQLAIDAAEDTPLAQELSRYVKDRDAVILLISYV